METNNLFDAIGYFKGLCDKNKLAKENGFFPCVCSGLNTLEEVIDNFRSKSAFFAVDDTNDGVTEQTSGGFFKKRTFTVFIFMSYKLGDMNARQNALDICRRLYRQIHSRMIRDKETLCDEIVYLNTTNILSREIGEYFLSGCTGLYFITDVSEPINLEYNSDEWEA